MYFFESFKSSTISTSKQISNFQLLTIDFLKTGKENRKMNAPIQNGRSGAFEEKKVCRKRSSNEYVMLDQRVVEKGAYSNYYTKVKSLDIV